MKQPSKKQWGHFWISDSAAKPLGAEMCLKKYHQNTFAKNKDGLYAILKRRVWTPFSSNIKNGGFCSRIDFYRLEG